MSSSHSYRVRGYKVVASMILLIVIGVGPLLTTTPDHDVRTLSLERPHYYVPKYSETSQQRDKATKAKRPFELGLCSEVSL